MQQLRRWWKLWDLFSTFGAGSTEQGLGFGVHSVSVAKESQAVRTDGQSVDNFVVEIWETWEEYSAIGGSIGPKTNVVKFLEAIFDKHPAVYNKSASDKSASIDDIITAMKIDDTRKESLKLQSRRANVLIKKPSTRTPQIRALPPLLSSRQS
ncbi:hypothetical protein HDU93_002713 [Gonapodya sp. JEL0774]|nr:hypothetical protein HDU93_002713 [Gonapodya sp. JEL0774]